MFLTDGFWVSRFLVACFFLLSLRCLDSACQCKRCYFVFDTYGEELLLS